MKITKTLDICIIGAGRLGTTVSYALSQKKDLGIRLKAVASRTGASLNRAKEIMGDKAKGVVFTTENKRAASLAECILISTPDDVIKNVCSEITEGEEENFNERYVVHFSGSKPLSMLDSARRAGARVASIHPLKSFASIREAIKTLPGTVFGITYSGAEAKQAVKFIVKGLEGSVIEVDDDKKALYHAAACVASNYLVTLINYAVFIHKKIGIEPEDSLKGLMGLIEGTVDNIKKMGTEKSLTGPIARGDIGTIKEHLENFKKHFNRESIGLYKVMGSKTSRIAYNNKWIDKKTVTELEKVLKN